jgi:hypothetical protein
MLGPLGLTGIGGNGAVMIGRAPVWQSVQGALSQVFACEADTVADVTKPAQLTLQAVQKEFSCDRACAENFSTFCSPFLLLGDSAMVPLLAHVTWPPPCVVAQPAMRLTNTPATAGMHKCLCGVLGQAPVCSAVPRLAAAAAASSAAASAAFTFPASAGLSVVLL